MSNILPNNNTYEYIDCDSDDDSINDNIDENIETDVIIENNESPASAPISPIQSQSQPQKTFDKNQRTVATKNATIAANRLQRKKMDTDDSSVQRRNHNNSSSSSTSNKMNALGSTTTTTAAMNPQSNKNQRRNNYNQPDSGAYFSNGDEAGYSTSSSILPSATSSTTQLSPMSALNEDRMRRKLQFYFMNPIEKWQARRRFPYKFVVQLIKIILVTMQLCLFAHQRYTHVNYTWDNRIAFSHLFLRGWDDTSEVDAYPPAKGPLALYVGQDFYETIDYALIGYKNLSRAIGSYSYPTADNSMPPIRFCIHHYEQGEIYGFNESYVFNPNIIIVCTNLMENTSETKSRAYLEAKGIPIHFTALVRATLEFSVKTVNFKAAGPIAPPDCYQFDIQILFDNSDHDGQMLLSLDAEPQRLHCNGTIEYITDTEIDIALRSILNIFVILVCIASFSLCTRALYRAYLLRNQTDTFFRVTYGYPLSRDDSWEFINFWYIMIILNDVLLILGSVIKDQIERKNFAADQWNICSVLLGVGNLLVWFGVLRYFSFFKTYNVVILTLKRATPKILRFLLCALLIYAGFTFCGWLVLGPYHIKFRSLATTSECLFSLINGDDMFATFSIMTTKSPMLWWFSRIYLYSFISLYIYVVLSLFIAVIMDAYDTIKKYYKEGFPNSDLKRFIGQMHPSDFSSGVFRANPDDEESESLWETIKNVCCMCCGMQKKENVGPTGYETLVTS